MISGEKTMNDPKRRKLVLGLAALPVSGLAGAAALTPSASEGPFYPTVGMRYPDIDNDLVKISGEVEQAGGEVVRLAGRVLDRDGKPIEAARVEIWQCDVRGRYLHRGDRGGKSRDRSFQGFGHDLTGADGGYSFRTIKPVPYPACPITPTMPVTGFISVSPRLAGSR
jgi:protocatechuate 3,4-dioxygenase beta subunit